MSEAPKRMYIIHNHKGDVLLVSPRPIPVVGEPDTCTSTEYIRADSIDTEKLARRIRELYGPATGNMSFIDAGIKRTLDEALEGDADA